MTLPTTGATTGPQTHPPAAPPAPVGRSRSKRILGWIALGLAVVLLVTVTGGYLVYRHLNGNITHAPITTEPGTSRPANLTKAQNILLIGSDTRDFKGGAAFGRDVGGARSDTTILVHLAAGGGRASLVSIPRDSYVEIPSCKLTTGSTGNSTPHMDKFNVAYSLGGPACTIATVESLTGIRIDHFVEVNFQGFQRMVNALGGVTVCISKPIYDPIRFVNGHYQGSNLNLKAGHDELDGKTALEFVRARYGVGDGSDIGRIKDQQLFISAVIRKATSAGLLVNLPALYSFLDAATKSIRTDPGFGLSQLRGLADRLHGLRPGKVALLTVPIVYDAPGVPTADVSWDPVKAPALWSALRGDQPLPGQEPTATPTPTPPTTASPTPSTTGPSLVVPPGEVTVRVLNGTGAPGIAHRVAAELGTDGFSASAGNAAAHNYTTTLVRYGAGRADSARTVAAAVPGATLQLDPALGSTVQLVIGQNFTSVQPVHVTPSATPSATATPSSSPSLNVVTADQDVCST